MESQPSPDLVSTSPATTSSSSSDTHEAESPEIVEHDKSETTEKQAKPSSQEYVVEKILDKQVVGDTVKYFVKWEGYPRATATWEPIDNLRGCEDMVVKFEETRAREMELRMANERLNPGTSSDVPTGSRGTARSRGRGSGRGTRARRRPATVDERPNPKSISIQKRRRTTEQGSGKSDDIELDDDDSPSEYKVKKILGVTKIGCELFFLISLYGTSKLSFIRASLAYQILSGKIIDFYISKLKWKTKETPSDKSKL